MINKRTNHYALMVLSLALMLTPLAHAGVVTQTSFVKAALAKKATLKQQRSRLEVLLDLSGYRNAAVSFDFAALMRLDTARLKAGSVSPSGFRDDFRLVSPISSPITRGQNRSSLRQNEPGFSRSSLGRRYSTAMFNLAAYDGQTVLLTLEFDRLAAKRRGVININNLRVAVSPTQTGPAGAAIPEPATLLLVLAAGLALLLVPANARRSTLAARVRGAPLNHHR